MKDALKSNQIKSLIVVIQPLSIRLIKPMFFFSHCDPRSTTVSLESRNSLNPMWLTTEGQCIYGGWLMSFKITYVLEPFGVLMVFYDDDGEDHQHEDCRTH